MSMNELTKIRIEEKNVWINMKKELKRHNTRNVRNKYYQSNNMRGWEAEKFAIEGRARSKMLHLRKKLDCKEKEEKEEKEKNEKFLKDTELNNVLCAAQALLDLKSRPYTRRESRKKNVLSQERCTKD